MCVPVWMVYLSGCCRGVTNDSILNFNIESVCDFNIESVCEGFE